MANQRWLRDVTLNNSPKRTAKMGKKSFAPQSKKSRMVAMISPSRKFDHHSS